MISNFPTQCFSNLSSFGEKRPSGVKPDVCLFCCRSPSASTFDASRDAFLLTMLVKRLFFAPPHV